MKRFLKIGSLFVVAAICREGVTAGIYPAMKRCTSKALPAVLLLCLLGLAAHAQEASGDKPAQVNPAASDGGAEQKDCVREVGKSGEGVLCVIDKVKSLRLDWGRRFARGLQYQYQLNEQQGSILIGSPAEIIRNPEDYLQQHTFTFKFGELFPDRLSLFKRGSDYLKKHPQAADRQHRHSQAGDRQLSEFLCGDKPLITCLTKGGSWWQRALMGTSFNVTLSERSAVNQGFVVTDPMFGHDYQVNGGFIFDPAKLFPTATSWKGAFDEVQKVDKALALLGTSDVRSGRRPWKQPVLAAIIPKVEFKVLSQFDFVKYNGVLIEAPFPERALNTLTLTWDLTRAIPDTKSRIDADVIDEALADLENNLGREEQPAWQKRCILHLSREDKVREVKDLHPAFSAASCQGLAKLKNAESYQLSCVKKGTQGGGDERVDGPKRGRLDAPAPPTGNVCMW